MRNLSNGETFETGMVNWKTRVYKIFLFARPQTICTLRYRVLWGFMLRHRRGEFHSTKVLFSPRTASLCPATRVHRNEKRFPRFRLQLLCFVEFHSIFLNKYFFFFSYFDGKINLTRYNNIESLCIRLKMKLEEREKPTLRVSFFGLCYALFGMRKKL